MEETMDQGTKEWLEWRRKGIGASESAALLGSCPYKTALMLWKEKTKGEVESNEESSHVFAKGHAVESQIRASYEFEHGIEFKPCLMEYGEWPVIRASLDGWNEESRKGIEIKYVGADKMQAPIPTHHYIQMQHQMLVAGVDSWTYVKSNDGAHYIAVDIQADKKIQMDIVSACMTFWDQVETAKEPEYTDRDWFPDDRQDLKDALADMEKATTTKVRHAYRAVVMGLVQRKRTICNGVKISKEPDRIAFPKAVENGSI
jgi:putative phage-type endonuclease